MTLTLPLAAVALLAMVAGELWRVSVPGRRRDAPLARATGVALVLVTSWPHLEDNRLWLLGIAGPILLALFAVVLGALWRRSTSQLLSAMAEIGLSVLVAGLLVRIPVPGSGSLHQQAEIAGGHAAPVALTLLPVATVAIAAPAFLRGALHLIGLRRPGRPQPSREFSRDGALGLATAITAVVMALAVEVIGVSFILFLVPLAVLQQAVIQQAQSQAAKRHTVFALSRLTDQAGLTPDGHASRVAALAVLVARRAGVEEADLADVEVVALLHDLGQVGLDRPIPAGATIEVSARDQRRIASTGAGILARTAELSRLAPMVADVGLPHYRAVTRGDVHLIPRVVRVVSAYDDLVTETALTGGQFDAQVMERLVRSTPHEFDPMVVRALLAHLERQGLLNASDLNRLEPSST